MVAIPVTTLRNAGGHEAPTHRPPCKRGQNACRRHPRNGRRRQASVNNRVIKRDCKPVPPVVGGGHMMRTKVPLYQSEKFQIQSYCNLHARVAWSCRVRRLRQSSHGFTVEPSLCSAHRAKRGVLRDLIGDQPSVGSALQNAHRAQWNGAGLFWRRSIPITSCTPPTGWRSPRDTHCHHASHQTRPMH